MLIDPETLRDKPEILEHIEKASLRLVVQAMLNYRRDAREIFQKESDLVKDIGEDITREALDKLGMSKIDKRLFGNIDYKRARYVFNYQYAIRQALFVDSKAEKISGQGTATLQMSQTSMTVRQMRGGEKVDVPGKLPRILTIDSEKYITTTLFVKYNYDETRGDRKSLQSMTVAAVPNGLLQKKYAPDAKNTIWIAGRNAPSLGEEFRARVSFRKLKGKVNWRVQLIPMPPDVFTWED